MVPQPAHRASGAVLLETANPFAGPLPLALHLARSFWVRSSGHGHHMLGLGEPAVQRKRVRDGLHGDMSVFWSGYSSLGQLATFLVYIQHWLETKFARHML